METIQDCCADLTCVNTRPPIANKECVNSARALAWAPRNPVHPAAGMRLGHGDDCKLIRPGIAWIRTLISREILTEIIPWIRSDSKPTAKRQGGSLWIQSTAYFWRAGFDKVTESRVAGQIGRRISKRADRGKCYVYSSASTAARCLAVKEKAYDRV